MAFGFGFWSSWCCSMIMFVFVSVFVSVFGLGFRFGFTQVQVQVWDCRLCSQFSTWLEPASAVVAGEPVLVTSGELPSVVASRECPEKEGVTPQEVLTGHECVDGKFPSAACSCICVQVKCSG